MNILIKYLNLFNNKKNIKLEFLVNYNLDLNK